LDIVRLIAFLSVFFHHISPRTLNTKTDVLADAAGFGLPLFFVLSAYLITTLLLREKQRTGKIAIAKFYQRRMLRIWPLYFAALAAGFLLSLLHGYFHLDWRWYLAACFMLGNTNLQHGIIFGHLWSISVEEQFYLMWPGLVRKLNIRNLVSAAVVLIVVANIVLIHYGHVHAISYYPVWFNSFVQFEMFAAGILLAIATFNETRWLSSWAVRTIFAASVLVVLVATEYFCHIETHGYPSTGPLSLCLGYALVAFFCALFIYALLGSRGWPKWLVHMGKVSYGLYVVHAPVIVFIDHVGHIAPLWLREALALLLTSALALLSYRFFETPFLKMKQHLEVIPSRPVDGDIDSAEADQGYLTVKAM
jgi:peptidoglycan/LPS O-acetylase OafA/YrhL